MCFPLQTPAVEAVEVVAQGEAEIAEEEADVQLLIAEFPAGLIGVLAVEHAAVV